MSQLTAWYLYIFYLWYNYLIVSLGLLSSGLNITKLYNIYKMNHKCEFHIELY